MKIFGNLKAKWKSMSGADKAKLVIEGICNLGADLLLGYLNAKLIPQDERKWKKAACAITTAGIGMAVGKAASDQMGELIDAFTDAKQEAEEKEDA